MVPHIIQRGHCILELGAHEAAILDLIDEVESASKDPRELSGLHQHFNRGVVFPLDLVGLRLKLLFILDAVVWKIHEGGVDAARRDQLVHIFRNLDRILGGRYNLIGFFTARSPDPLAFNVPCLALQLELLVVSPLPALESLIVLWVFNWMVVIPVGVGENTISLL